MFILILFIVAHMQKLPKCPQICCMGKFGAVYSYNIILFSDKNEAIIHATVWMKLENAMLSERSNKKLYNIGKHFYEMSRIGKSIRTEIKLVNATDWREG